MKKLIILTCALCVCIGSANAAEQFNTNVQKDFKRPPIERKNITPEQMHKMKKAHEAAFEQKLGLTEVQKLKAGELRKSGHEKMKPVMEEIKLKKQEAEKIRKSNLSVQQQEEKLTVIDKDLADLEKQAKEIRKQNMKNFESILTKDQKKTLKNMKKEGRQKYENSKKGLNPPPCPHHEKF